MQLRIKDMIASERPRERLLKYGYESLSNAELIGLILRTGTQKENAVTLANRLLKKFPLNELGAKRLSQFQEIKGIGLAKACQLIAAFELGRRCSSPTWHDKISIKSSRDAANILAPEMEDLDKETVDIVPNYDETKSEPTVFPSKFPNLICNGSSGIAVGMATNIPPHNLNELTKATILVLYSPDTSIEEIMQVMPGPDFPTGGVIRGIRGIREAYHSGRGKLTLRAVTHVEDIEGSANRQRIIID